MRLPFRDSLSLRAFGLIAFALLALVSLGGSRQLVYDETYYVRETVELYARLGPTAEYLNRYPYPAGLPNSLLLAQLGSAGRRPPLVRIYNLILFAGVAAGAARLSRAGGFGGWGWAGMALANPVVWVLTGLALTEPLAVLAMTWAVVAVRLLPQPVIGAAAGGLLFGVAVLVRPQLLVLVPVFLALCWDRPSRGAMWAAFAIAAAALPGPLFLYWGDLVSPAVRAAAFYGSDRLAPGHAILGLAYAAAMTALLAPRWFHTPWAKAAVGVGLGATIGNVMLGGVEVAPAMQVAARLLPPALAPYYPRAMGGVAVGVATAYAVTLAFRLRDWRAAGLVPAAAACAVGLLALSCAKITHQFSSRYVAIGFPFLLLAAGPFRGPPRWELARLALGSALGALMLRSYFA